MPIRYGHRRASHWLVLSKKIEGDVKNQKYLKKKVAEFDRPTSLPTNEEQAYDWQKANRSWWEANPMRYDWSQSIDFEEYSKEFFEEIDNRFFSKVIEFMPAKKIPFDALIPFDELSCLDVLEIGVGNGSIAQLLASKSKSFSGIDLTDYAYNSTSKRMETFSIKANIQQMDAENMTFEDNSFDYIWSWGVIHHSSDTERILQEMYRVLRPGGCATVMIYYRNFWNFWVCAGFLRGILLGEILKFGTVNRVLQNWWDGAIARFYTSKEWKDTVSPYFEVSSSIVYGSKPDIFPLPRSRFKNAILSAIPNSATRFFGTRCKMGTFLVTELKCKKPIPA